MPPIVALIVARASKGLIHGGPKRSFRRQVRKHLVECWTNLMHERFNVPETDFSIFDAEDGIDFANSCRSLLHELAKSILHLLKF